MTQLAIGYVCVSLFLGVVSTVLRSMELATGTNIGPEPWWLSVTATVFVFVVFACFWPVILVVYLIDVMRQWE